MTMMKNQPMAPSRADGASGDFPFHDPRIRSWAREMLGEAIHAYEVAVRRRDELEWIWGSIAGGTKEHDRVAVWSELAGREADAARAKVAMILLVMWGDAAEASIDADNPNISGAGIAWKPRGACVDERLVLVKPGEDDRGFVVYDLDHAELVLVDLADVVDLGCILSPDSARKAGNPE